MWRGGEGDKGNTDSENKLQRCRQRQKTKATASDCYSRDKSCLNMESQMTSAHLYIQ